MPVLGSETGDTSALPNHSHDSAQVQLVSDSVAQLSTLAEQHQEEPTEKPALRGTLDFLMSSKYLAWFGMMIVGVVLLLLKGINRWVRL